MREQKTLYPRRVHKYVVPQPDSDRRSYVWMPADAEILSIGLQGPAMVVWALCCMPFDADASWEFIVANTGDTIPMPGTARFLGTVTVAGTTVWHVWENGRV